MAIVTVDFETYYDDECSVVALGPEAYVRHPDFHVILTAVKNAGGVEVFEGDDMSWVNLIRPGDIVTAHNARFECAVTEALKKSHSLGNTRGPQSNQWRCTADLAVYLGAGRSLRDASADLLGTVVDKDERSKAKGRSLQWFRRNPAKFEAFKEYCKRDAVLSYRLWTDYGHLWPESEQKISELNREFGSFGICIDLKTLRENLDAISTQKWEAARGIPWDWADKKTPLSFLAVAKQCRAQNIPSPGSLAEKDEQYLLWEAQYADQCPWVKCLRDWRKLNRLEKILRTLLARADEQGVMSYETKYFGAHTGRFSGGGGFNIQNLPRKASYGVDLRGLIVPRPGHRFIVADFSQIEARLLLWLAGDTQTLDIVRSGVNIYEAHARQTMGWAGGVLKDEGPHLYALAKARVLGLGYGAGGLKFKLLAAIYGVNLTESEASSAVWDFRKSNPRILALWALLERNFKWAYQAQEPFELELPSGRVMTYRDITSTDNGLRARTAISGNLTYVYGGKLTENLVQAVAREVFADRMLALNDALPGRLRFHVHDEYVLEAPTDAVPAQTAKVQQVIKAAEDIPWLKGCPIDAELQVVDRYTK